MTLDLEKHLVDEHLHGTEPNLPYRGLVTYETDLADGVDGKFLVYRVLTIVIGDVLAKFLLCYYKNDKSIDFIS